MTQVTAWLRQLRNKVSEPTPSSWFIKVFATTIGATTADLLRDTLGFGAPSTTATMAAVLTVLMMPWFRASTRRPIMYSATVALISIVGTCVVHNLTDGLGVPLGVRTAIFAAVFILWRGSDYTLSIHEAGTGRREAFCWLAILFTFTLGTAAGGLLAERTSRGDLPSLLAFATAIATVIVVWFVARGSDTCFWGAYIPAHPHHAPVAGTRRRVWNRTTAHVVGLAAITSLIAWISVSLDNRVRMGDHERPLFS